MTITLITGATRGLGLEAARQLVAAGHTVYLGARDARRGAEAAQRTGAEAALDLDVTSDDSVRAAAERLREREGRLDVLVNNAGIPGPPLDAHEVTAEALHSVYDTNVYGAVRTTHAFLPLLRAGEAPAVVNVSSGLGSIAACADPAERGAGSAVPVWIPAPAYASSKAALNMLTAQYGHACPGIRFTAVDPGFTATDFNGRTGTQTPAEGAEIIVRTATATATATDTATAITADGGFVNAQGRIPW